MFGVVGFRRLLFVFLLVVLFGFICGKLLSCLYWLVLACFDCVGCLF